VDLRTCLRDTSFLG